MASPTDGTVKGTHGFDWDSNPDHSQIEWQVSQFDSGKPGSGPYGADPDLQSATKSWQYGAGTGPAGPAAAKQPR